MVAKTDKLPVDDVDRLKRVAFWYWEYMRRNPLYKKYCKVINRYDNYFKKIGVYDYMQSKEYLEEMSEYLSTHESKHDLEHTPFRNRLEAEHGKEAGRLFFKYGFLGLGYEKKFGRVYKDCADGLDSYAVIDNFLAGKTVGFASQDIRDLSALIKLNGTWMVSVDEYAPDNFSYDLERSSSIKIDPKGILNNPAKVGLEIHALNLINKAVNSLFGKQRASEETLQSVYKLSLSGKHIISSDAMRLAMLWLWDKAHEADESNPARFDEVYSLLKAKLEKKGMADGAWEQILTRRKRTLGYYEMTSYCIKNRIVTSLNQ